MAASSPYERSWSAPAPAAPALHAAVERLAGLRALDAAAEPIADSVRDRLGSGRLKDALSGRWLGHALHPLLSDLPIGAWTSALALDLLGGRDSEPAVQRLLALGFVASGPTALAGWSEWADSTRVDERVRRVGLVHAAANATAVALHLGSLLARRHGARRGGRRLALAGAGALAAGGYLGGYLTFTRGTGVNRTAFLGATPSWTDALADGELAEGAIAVARVDHEPVMLTRRTGRIFCLADRCSHRGAPLHEGEIAAGQVTCPLHRSRFWLEDGAVAAGPAAYPQPAYDVRERAGRIELRLRAEPHPST